MTAGTARTGPRPRTWAGGGWAGTARPTTACHRDHAVGRRAGLLPVRPVPYTPAKHFAKGKNDPAFRTKLAIDAGLALQPRRQDSRSARSSRTAPTAIR